MPGSLMNTKDDNDLLGHQKLLGSWHSKKFFSVTRSKALALSLHSPLERKTYLFC